MNPNSKISLIVVDDHPLFLQGVVDVLSLEEDIAVVGQAETGDDALALIRAELPQIALLDVNLPGMNGQQITRQLKNEKLPTRVILLTAYDDAEQKIHAMLAGASAYCAKDIQPEKLIEMVRTVNRGKYVIGEETYDPDTLNGWLEGHLNDSTRQYSDPGEPFHPLSTREMDVLGCITRGLSNKEIAISLGISHQTVKNHVTAILRKLAVEDRTQAAIYAYSHGWVRMNLEDTEVSE
ncbi:MAG TPA: response regulator transcription factor [Anaerolineales bacterium]|nr:response regulator transcription factor [Anaerolineales bacterium]